MSKPEKFHAWNPGLGSTIPGRLLPLATIFDPKNASTEFSETLTLADLTGLPPHSISQFRLERLLIHELLIRVTCDLTVPDGPQYEALGLNLRGMVRKMYENHFLPKIATYQRSHDVMLEEAGIKMHELFDTEAFAPKAAKNEPWYKRLFSTRIDTAQAAKSHEHHGADGVDHQIETAIKSGDGLQSACARAVRSARHAFFNQQGYLPREHDLVVKLALILFSNDYGAQQLRFSIADDFLEAARLEKFRFLPSQEKPFVLNVKGASAAGKSTIRPQQRELAQRLGIAWDDFALVSPDYWRKYLLDYASLGDDSKYGAMLTGRELEIIDQKLDAYMAQKAVAGTMPHLLIDRFRFDSFAVNSDSSSRLLSRFGDSIFMFFIITPPEETVERAWKRGQSTGRYKAVDDLLYHNVEAYTGMSQLFFSWATPSDKKIHFEFLDNNVPQDRPPRTVAFGWNDNLTVLDIEALANIDRFREINIEAEKPENVYQSSARRGGFEFLKQCAGRLSSLSFAKPGSAEIYAKIENGNWHWCDQKYLKGLSKGSIEKAALEALGCDEQVASNNTISPSPIERKEMRYTLGDWQDHGR